MSARHHTIDYLEITVAGVAAAKEFYGQAFGWQFNDYGPGYAGIRATGDLEAGGLTAATDGDPIRPPLAIVYSDDLEATEGAVRAAGGQIVVEPFDFPGGRRFHFRDPAGNELAVWTQTPHS